MRTGIIILNYNTFDDCVECVKSIKQNNIDAYRIYIVDNCSSDDSYFRLVDAFRGDINVEIIKSNYNGGFSYGNNVGIKKAISDGMDLLLISNPDVIYYNNSINNMINALVSDEKIGIIGPSCKSLDEEESQLFRKRYNDLIYIFSKKPFRYFRFLKSLKSEYVLSEKDKIGVYKFDGMVRGCCFLIKSDLFKKMNFFDDNVFLYCEEWIIAQKLSTYNLLCACNFDSKVLHKEASSTKKRGSAFQTFHLYLSAFYYLKIYNKTPYVILFFYYVTDIFIFSVKSIFNKKYRLLFKHFVRKISRLMFSNRDVFNKKNKIYARGDEC